MPREKTQCLLCGRRAHFGPCGSQELMLPLPGGGLDAWDIDELTPTEKAPLEWTLSLRKGANK